VGIRLVRSNPTVAKAGAEKVIEAIEILKASLQRYKAAGKLVQARTIQQAIAELRTASKVGGGNV
jgi:hypothetical protein